MSSMLRWVVLASASCLGVRGSTVWTCGSPCVCRDQEHWLVVA